MKIPSYARYDYCNQKACEFLEDFNITSFPIDIERIIHQNKWGLMTYSELMNKLHCPREKVIHILGSADGYTIWDEYNYTIAYNDDPSLGARTRFTLMHEIGHIYLRHLVDFEMTQIYRGSLSKQEYKVLENEANAFARNVLIPTSMLDHLVDKSVYNISTRFGVTLAAAKTRLSLYNVDIEKNQQANIIGRLYSVYYNFRFKKRCIICGYSTISKDTLYCPICGSKNTLQWGDGDKLKYKMIELNQNSKALRCPVCDNEEIPEDGTYCPICGTVLINQCTNDYPGQYNEPCGALAAGNARYCIYCGAPTTFFEKKILKAWNESESSDFVNIPDELPFP